MNLRHTLGLHATSSKRLSWFATATTACAIPFSAQATETTPFHGNTLLFPPSFTNAVIIIAATLVVFAVHKSFSRR